VAQISAQSDDGRVWTVAEDLLASSSEDALFVPEIERDASVFLRFGDGTYGMAADSGLSFTCSYKVGNGTRGNVGQDALAHMVFQPNAIRTVRNPLAAAGGTDAESIDHARQWAPFAFQSQQRCVTEDDYSQQTPQPGVIRQARGTLRWTGSWYTAFVSVDPVQAVTSTLIQSTTQRLQVLRMMGTDLAVEGAVIVGLAIQMRICVAPDHFVGDVYTALMKVFISGDQCNGPSGLLNAANFAFGATVYASPLLAAAQAVPGVAAASLALFTRMDDPSVDGVAQGYLTLGRLELARCDNDPNHLDHGTFELLMEGGK
jgi:predicted phage baseplate assembly protein